MESILISVKEFIGFGEEYRSFDSEIISDINEVFLDLNQLGVGPKEVFSIEDETSSWTDFLPAEDKLFEVAKTFVKKSTKLAFDPPTVSAHLEALERQIKKLGWRLMTAADKTTTESQEENSKWLTMNFVIGALKV